MITKDDPYYHCTFFKDNGCAHVDGLLCDFPKCKMNKDYENSKSNASRDI